MGSFDAFSTLKCATRCGRGNSKVSVSDPQMPLASKQPVEVVKSGKKADKTRPQAVAGRFFFPSPNHLLAPLYHPKSTLCRALAPLERHARDTVSARAAPARPARVLDQIFGAHGRVQSNQ